MSTVQTLVRSQHQNAKKPKPVQGLQISSFPIFTNISTAMCEPVQGPVHRSVLHKDRKAASGIGFS